MSKFEVLGSLLDSIRTGPFGSSLHAAEYTPGGTPVINPQHYSAEKIIPDSNVAVGPDVAQRLSAFALLAGDVVVARRGEMGRCAVVRSEQAGWLLGTGSAALRVGCRLLPSFLAYFLRSPGTVRALTRESVGSTMANLNQKILLSLPCYAPGVGQQRRIVAEIEKQFTRLDATVATLERVKANLKLARASVLKAAVEGRLVPTEADLARAEGRVYVPASVLLARILDERKARWPKGKKYKPPMAPDTEGLLQLPEGWVCATIDQAARELRYGTSAKCSSDDLGVPVLRMGNIVDGRIIYTNLKFLSASHAEFPEQLLEAGELLFNRTNSPELVGKSAVFNGYSRPCACASYLIRVSFTSDVKSQYVGTCLNSPRGRAWVRTVVVQQVGQANVNGTKLRAHVIPLPPLAEQQRIVAEVERRMSVLDHLEATVTRSLARCAQVRQSILKLAFEGKLVPQDPADEPASVLLEKIHSA